MTAEPIVDGAAATACNQTASTRPGASPDSTGRPGNGGTPRGMRAAEVLSFLHGDGRPPCAAGEEVEPKGPARRPPAAAPAARRPSNAAPAGRRPPAAALITVEEENEEMQTVVAADTLTLVHEPGPKPRPWPYPNAYPSPSANNCPPPLPRWASRKGNRLRRRRGRAKTGSYASTQGGSSGAAWAPSAPATSGPFVAPS